MRTHNFGVLVQIPAVPVDVAKEAVEEVSTPAARSPDATAGDDSQIDAQSGQDLQAALTRLGHRVTILTADGDLDLKLRAARILWAGTLSVLARRSAIDLPELAAKPDD